MLIGIDLGTTFSAVAHVGENGQAEIIENRDGTRVMPSVVMFEDGAVVVGEQAKENSIVDPFGVCQFVKRQMGQKAFSFDVSENDHFSAKDISAMILKRLKEDAEEGTGEKVTGAVITVPAYFDDAQRKATQDAGKIAGLNVLGIINEPTAAALAYCHGQANADGTVMVFDLGGGTFDITVLQLSNNLKDVEILSTTGIRNMGGFDFDNEIILKVQRDFLEKYGIDLDEDDVAMQDLRLKAENAKKALSSRPKTTVSVVSGGKALKDEITRAEFEEMIAGHLDSMKLYMELALEDAHITWKDISKVLLVGGSTRIPAVQNLVKQVSGIAPSRELNPDEAVALGAAYYAHLLIDQKEGIKETVLIKDVNSHSLGIIANNDYGKPSMTRIIPRNSTLPVVCEEAFNLTANGQNQINLRVVEGEDEDPAYDTLIGNSVLSFDPKPAGYPIIVAMEYDINGMIHVSVRDGVTNAFMGEMKIERASNLTEDEIEAKKAKMDGIEVD